MTATSLDDVLAHYGVKGMKWGVRNDRGHEGERAKTKKIAKLDRKFEKNAQSFQTTVKIHNRAADLTNKNDVARINNKPEYKDADFTRDSPLRQKYYKEHQTAYINNLERAAGELGTNASGTKRYSILEQQDGSWDIYLRDVRHAADEAEYSVRVRYADDGRILSIESADEALLIQSGTASTSDILAHYGVKGMKWGVRKSETERQQSFRDAAKKKPQPVDVKTAPGRKIKTSGGKGFEPSPEAVRTAVARQQAKKSRVQSLSNDELQAAVRRMQLEQQFTQLSNQQSTGVAGTLKAGKNFVKELLGMGQTANDVMKFNNSPAGVELNKKLKETKAKVS